MIVSRAFVRSGVTAAVVVMMAAAATARTAPVQLSSQGRDTRAWYQAYSDGVRAIAARNWQAAIDSLMAAKRAGPRPGRNIPSYGDNIIEFYAPDYYLGVAYLNLQRFADADAAFRQVRQLELIQPKDREYGAFDTQASRASFEVLVTGAEAQISRGELPSARDALRQAKALGLDGARVGRLEERLNKAELDAAEARKKAEGTDTTPASTSTIPTPPTVPGTTSTPITIAPTTVPITVPPTTVLPLTTSSVSGGDRTEPGITPTSAAEANAMAMFFAGDYGGAVAALTPLATSGTPSPAVSFYLACSKAALVLTGQADRAVLDDARALYAQVVGASQFSEDRKYISPRILQLLEGRQ
jgi:tetratricopeptide (TPR) repeat protein